jgi:hypothetical protein
MEFIETPAFSRHLARYLDDEQHRRLQDTLASMSELGDVIPGTGGFRKLRWADARRGKGRPRCAAGHLLLVRWPTSDLAYDRLRQE